MDDYYALHEGPREHARRRAKELGMPYVDLERIQPDTAALVAIPRSLGEKFRALPIKRESRWIWVSVGADPLPNVKELEEETGLEVYQVLALESWMDAALKNGAWWRGWKMKLPPTLQGFTDD